MFDFFGLKNQNFWHILTKIAEIALELLWNCSEIDNEEFRLFFSAK